MSAGAVGAVVLHFDGIVVWVGCDEGLLWECAMESLIFNMRLVICA